MRWYLTDPYRGRREYDDAHVPGATFVDLHNDLAGSVGGGRHPLPTTYEFAAHLSRLGIGPGDLVVAYDSAGGAVASRLWWMLHAIGHARTAVLDGGYHAWEAAGRPTTDVVVARVPTGYPVVKGWRGVVDADEITDLVESGTTLIDARAAERFHGEVEPIDPRAGHIPGAINLPHLDNLGSEGRHRSADELRRTLRRPSVRHRSSTAVAGSPRATNCSRCRSPASPTPVCIPARGATGRRNPTARSPPATDRARRCLRAWWRRVLHLLTRGGVDLLRCQQDDRTGRRTTGRAAR